MLGYKKRVQRLFNFEVGTKLVCVNTFGRESEMRKDLIPGPKYSQTWNVVYPVIAEMVSSDFEKIEQRKKEIGNEKYVYIRTLADEYTKLKPNVYRNGLPVYAQESAIL